MTFLCQMDSPYEAGKTYYMATEGFRQGLKYYHPFVVGQPELKIISEQSLVRASAHSVLKLTNDPSNPKHPFQFQTGTFAQLLKNRLPIPLRVYTEIEEVPVFIGSMNFSELVDSAIEFTISEYPFEVDLLSLTLDTTAFIVESVSASDPTVITTNQEYPLDTEVIFEGLPSGFEDLNYENAQITFPITAIDGTSFSIDVDRTGLSGGTTSSTGRCGVGVALPFVHGTITHRKAILKETNVLANPGLDVSILQTSGPDFSVADDGVNVDGIDPNLSNDRSIVLLNNIVGTPSYSGTSKDGVTVLEFSDRIRSRLNISLPLITTHAPDVGNQVLPIHQETQIKVMDFAKKVAQSCSYILHLIQVGTQFQLELIDQLYQPPEIISVRESQIISFRQTQKFYGIKTLRVSVTLNRPFSGTNSSLLQTETRSIELPHLSIGREESMEVFVDSFEKNESLFWMKRRIALLQKVSVEFRVNAEIATQINIGTRVQFNQVDTHTFYDVVVTGFKIHFEDNSRIFYGRADLDMEFQQ